MTKAYTKYFYNLFVLALTSALLSACAPPQSIPASSNNTLELRKVYSAIEKQNQNIKNLSAQVSELESRIQLQSNEIEQLRQRGATAQPAYQPTGLPAPTGTTVMQGEGSPTEVYLQAFGDYASGRYQAAISGFESFLQRFPNNSYASNAQFWLADCYFNQQQYALAKGEFEHVLNNYPNAAKVPDALLKIAIAQLQLENPDEARQTINVLNQRYPKSSATQKAQELAIP
jgi:tol-pal system protein YbgF